MPGLAVVSAAAVAATFAASWLVVGQVLRLLQGRAILDHPNQRSSHTVPTPRGGGLGVVAVLLVVWAGAAVWAGAWSVLAVLLAAAGLAAVSWSDDLGGLAVAPRLAAQAACVGAALALAPLPGPVAGGLLPPAFDLALTAALWLWFINLFNFMDGIDGLAGAETAAIGVGVAAVAAIAGVSAGPLLNDNALVFAGLTAAAAAAGFLVWNWHPARVFLGDVGSIPLGFLLGWLLLELAARGQPAAAAILPSYYLVDATVTLLRRLARGERPWQAHREHAYQRAVAAGWRHDRVVIAVSVANLGLLVAAVAAAAGVPAVAVAAACLIVAGLHILLLRGQRQPDTAV